MEATKLWEEQRQAQLARLKPIEFENQRIMTTRMLAEQFGTEEKIISQNFIRNESRFVKGKHFYKLEGEELKEFKGYLQNEESLKFVSVLYLWTEKGAARHAKILDTDEAWEVYEVLEDTYFNTRENHQENFSCIEDVLIQSLQAIKQVKEQANQANYHALEAKDEISSFKKQYKEDRDNDPLFGVECEDLQKVVKRVATNILGGHGSPAYLDKSVSGKVYSDVQRQIKREFGLRSYKAIKRSQLDLAIRIVEGYKAPFVLQQEICCLNNQLSIKEG